MLRLISTRLGKIDAAITELTQSHKAIVLQNQTIIAMLKGSRLSPADQAKLNQIFATAEGDSAKIDAVISPKTGG